MQENYRLWQPLGDYREEDTKEERRRKTDKKMKRLLEVYAEQEALLEKYHSILDRMLSEKRKASEMEEVVMQPEFRECCNMEYDLQCFLDAWKAAAIEEESNMRSNLYVCDNMEEVCANMQALVFGLRRVELDWEEETLSSFLSQIEEQQVSPVFLGELICRKKIGDKIHTAERMAGLLNKIGRHKEVILFLFYVADQLNNEEEAVLAFANALLETGDIRMGNEMLGRIENPKPEIVRLRKMLEERL